MAGGVFGRAPKGLGVEVGRPVAVGRTVEADADEDSDLGLLSLAFSVRFNSRSKESLL